MRMMHLHQASESGRFQNRTWKSRTSTRRSINRLAGSSCLGSEVARLFGVSLSTVTRWARTGRIETLRTPGGHYRYLAEDVRVRSNAPQAEAGLREAPMNAILVRGQRYLDRPLGTGSRVLLFLCALLVLPTRVRPDPGEHASGASSWLPFALGALALLFLRACVQGKVRDLLDVAVMSVYFVLFLLVSGAPRDDLSRLVIVVVLAAAALVVAWMRASADDAAEARSAG